MRRKLSNRLEAKDQDIPDYESLTILYSPLREQDLRHVHPFAKGDTNDEKWQESNRRIGDDHPNCGTIGL